MSRNILIGIFFFGLLIKLTEHKLLAQQVDQNGDIDLVIKSQGIKNYPCSRCHKSGYAKKIKFPLKEPHNYMVFKHMEEVNNCNLCHSNDHPDKLNYLYGEEIGYEGISLICGQCHGIRFRDWKIGLHGRQIGLWNGRKTRVTCAECHNAHSPKFPLMQSVAPHNHDRTPINPNNNGGN